MKKARKIALILVGLAAVAVAYVLFFPVLGRSYVYKPSPPPSFEEAVRGLNAIIAATPDVVGPAGQPRIFVHDKPTKEVFVFLHGLSNAPEQFAPLGKMLYERGHNVVIPRLPYHGEKDRMTESWAALTGYDLLKEGNEAVDLARGLGEHVTVMGLSVSGATAAWMAQNRSDVRCVLAAPFLAPAGIPDWLTSPVGRLLLRMPNVFVWWNSALQMENPGPPHAYPRFPTRVIGEVMLLSDRILSAAAETRPKSPSIFVFTTENDAAANNGFTEKLVEKWRSHNAERLNTFQFPATQKVPHDFIDPTQPEQQTALVYPKLIEVLEQGTMTGELRE